MRTLPIYIYITEIKPPNFCIVQSRYNKSHQYDFLYLTFNVDK